MDALGGIRDHAGRRLMLALIVSIMVVAGRAGSTAFTPFELPVVVEESPGLVRLHVLLPEGMPAASIEVRVVERTVVVQGRYRNGLPMRSRPILLFRAVSAEGADAGFADDGSLTITLHTVAEGGS